MSGVRLADGGDEGGHDGRDDGSGMRPEGPEGHGDGLAGEGSNGPEGHDDGLPGPEGSRGQKGHDGLLGGADGPSGAADDGGGLAEGAARALLARRRALELAARKERLRKAIGQNLDERYGGRHSIVLEADSFMWDMLLATPHVSETLGELIERLAAKQGIPPEVVAERSRLSPGYIEEVVRGARSPRRDALIRLAFGLMLDVPDADRLLERGEACRLRADDRRDAAIIMCLHWRVDISVCDSVLYDLGERMLCVGGAQPRMT